MDYASVFYDNYRNFRALTGQVSLSISGQTHEFIIVRCVNERERAIWQFVIVKNKWTSVFHASALLLTIKFIIATRFMVTNRTDAWKTDLNLLNLHAQLQLPEFPPSAFYKTFFGIWGQNETFSLRFPSHSSSVARKITDKEIFDLHFVQKVHQKSNKRDDEERDPKHETRVQHAVLRE